MTLSSGLASSATETADPFDTALQAIDDRIRTALEKVLQAAAGRFPVDAMGVGTPVP